MALKTLGTEHWIAIKYLAQPKKGGLTFKQIADECGVHVNTIDNWRKDPLFERELKREIMRKTVDRLPEIMESIPNHIIKDGNAALFKTLLQANDMLTDRVEVSSGNSDGQSIEDIKAKIARYKGDSTSE
ncbi:MULTISPECIES: helix-turn-helix domain-containing protein [Bacillus]|uniref:helix-turn-helix domain-containing protein n=1 Tax=Bacillus TaxID=1386 RepID=UPI00037DB83C|nr:MULTISPECIES: helix-turn-helix domain-containing protein [Bacillus]